MEFEYNTQQSNNLFGSFLDFLFNSGFIYLIWFLVLIIIIFLIRLFIKKIIVANKQLDYKIFLIKLPKEKPGDQGKDFTVQELREEIAAAETIFGSIGGLRAERSLKAWFLGRNDHFSFEVVANQKKISFYVVSPVRAARYIEQEIHAHYPDASIEEVEDYNIFSPQSHVRAGIVKTTREFLFPLKTYQKMDVDPMNSIINVLSKLKENEGLAVQFVVRSAKGVWHKRASEVVKKVHQGKKLEEALSLSAFSKIMNFLGSVADIAKPDQNSQNNINQPQKLSAMEEEMLKGIEEKNSKAGLDVNIRLIVSAENQGQSQMYIENIVNAFSQYNYYEYGNSFRKKEIARNQNKIIRDFIYRRFNSTNKILLNIEELASMYHFPLRGAETPNIVWLTAREAVAPADIPEEGILLGYNMHRGIKKEIRIKREDRRRHMYIVGKSGGGKSQFIANMAVQDILNGEGVCVLDPHGDLVEDVLVRIPPERAEDVIVFAPYDIERPMALNLVEFDPKYPEQKTFVINEMINIFDKLYDLKSTGGPIFEQYMRNALLLIMSDPESGSTLMEVPKVLSDAEFRKMKLEKCSDPTIVDFWVKEAEKAGGDAALANVVPYITSKLTQFISNDLMRPIIGQQDSSINFRDAMDNQKILLVDLSKGKIGEMNAFLLGMVLIGKILMQALSRADMSADKRKDFYLYIDEFQNFTTDSICSILSEARKYGLSLIIAHQYIGQLVDKGGGSAIKDAVFGNVGSMILFRIGSDDAEELEKEFSPVFNQYDLLNIEKFTTYAKILIDNTASRPFSMKNPWPIAGEARENMSKKIRNLSRLKYGRDRNIIEAEIKQRTNLGTI